MFRHLWRIPYLLLIAGASVFFAIQCLSLRVDQDNRSMDADNETGALIEEEFREKFHESDPVLVAIHWSEILSDRGQALIETIVSELMSIQGVAEVFSMESVNFQTPAYLENLLFSEDRDTVGIMVRLEEFDDNGESLAKMIQEIRMYARANSYNEAKVTVTGLPLQKYEVGRLVREDQKLFSPLAFIVLAGVLLLVTNRFTGVVLPLLACGITICWTLGIYAFFGFSLNMITSLLPPVIMTISVATTIHIYLHWLHGTNRCKTGRIVSAVKELYRPCLFASLTTAIGFLSLTLNNTPAVRQFGMFAALGVLISYILGISILATLLSFLKPPHPGKRDHSILCRVSMALAGFAISHPWKIVLFTLVVTPVCIFGIQKVKSNTDLLAFLGNGNQLVQDTMTIDRDLTGVNVIELLIDKADRQPFSSYDEVNQIGQLQDAIESLPSVTHCLSIADLLDDPDVVDSKANRSFTDLVADMGIEKYLEPGLHTTRLTVRIAAIGTSEGASLVRAMRSEVDTHLGNSYIVREAGGFFRLVEESNQLVATQIKSFAIAIGVILLAIGMVFRTFSYIWLAAIPNVIPLLMTGGIMGFCEIDLSTGTTMIASVVIGVAVDDTIHYLSAYRKKLMPLDCDRAILETSRSTGVALISTTLALSFGFWVAVFGSFQPTIYFAMLSGLTMWFALSCDLVVLPACLKIADTFRNSNNDIDDEEAVQSEG